MHWRKAIKDHFEYKFSRSSGSGGQHVNKVETKVALVLKIKGCGLFNEKEMLLLSQNLGKRLNKKYEFVVVEQRSRSQHRNRQVAFLRALRLIDAALKSPKKRKESKPSPALIQKRLQSKKRQSEKKLLRKKPILH